MSDPLSTSAHGGADDDSAEEKSMVAMGVLDGRTAGASTTPPHVGSSQQNVQEHSSTTTDDRLRVDKFESIATQPVEIAAAESQPQAQAQAVQQSSDPEWIGRLKQFPVLYMYLGPVTGEISYSLLAIIYHFLNFFFAMGVWIFLVTAVCTFVPFIILACVGLPLLWLTAEIMIWISKANLGMKYSMNVCVGVLRCVSLFELQFTTGFAFWLVESDPEVLNNAKSLQCFEKQEMPPCSSVCDPSLTEHRSRLARVGYLASSCQMYSVLVYHSLVHPFMVLITAWTVLLPLVAGYLMVNWVIFVADPKYFADGNQCWGSSKKGDNSCNGWNLNSGGDMFALFLMGLVLMPLALLISTSAARLSKSVAYFFLSDKTYGNSQRAEQTAALIVPESSEQGNDRGHVVVTGLSGGGYGGASTTRDEKDLL